MEEPAFDKLRQDVDKARQQVLKILNLKHQWICPCCGAKIKRGPKFPYSTRNISEQVAQLYTPSYSGPSSSIVSLAVFGLHDDGYLELTNDLKWKIVKL